MDLTGSEPEGRGAGKRANMYLRTAHLQNFRRFDERNIDLHPQVTLITGRNGSGRTSVLDALAAGLGALVEALGVPSRALVPGDLRRGAEPGANGDPPHAAVELDARIAGEDHLWSRTGAPHDRLPRSPADRDTLPVFAYHGGAPRPVVDTRPAPRLASYTGCFEIGDPELATVARLAELVAGAASGARPAALDAVEAALTECIGDSDPVVLSAVAGVLHLRIGEAEAVPFAELGGAHRRVACLFADITLRCCTSNPDLGSAAPASTPGVVLVEQLEAGLHPRWQRYLMDDFRRVFPLVQLVATTQSPFLLQALHVGDHVDLDGRRPADVARLSIEDITEEVLGVPVPQRSKRFHDMQRAAADILRLVKSGAAADSKEKVVLKALLDEKMAPFSNDPAWTAVLQMQRTAAGLGSDAATDDHGDDDEMFP